MSEESFYTLDGELINTDILVNKMISFFNDALGEKATQITDFNEGSEVRNLLESVAVDIYDLMWESDKNKSISFLTYAEGEWLDLHAEALGTVRGMGSEAYGTLLFEIPAPATSPIVIEENTIVVNEETEARYITEDEETISVGETSVTCPASSYLPGEDMNCPADTITIFLDNPPYIDMTVTNPSAFTGGMDEEDDDELRARLEALNTQDTFGSLSYYQNLALAVPYVHDIKITPSLNENYTNIVYVNFNTKPDDIDLINTMLVPVVEAFTDQENIVLGHRFQVMVCGYEIVNLRLDIYVDDLVDDNDIIDVLQTLFDGGTGDTGYYASGLNIEQPLTRYDIIKAVETLDGVADVDMVWRRIWEDDEPIDEIFSTISPALNNVFKLGTVTINQNIIGD